MELIVKGMTCGHCEAAVVQAVKRAAPLAEVRIERAAGRVSVSGAADRQQVTEVIRAEGYEVAGAI